MNHLDLSAEAFFSGIVNSLETAENPVDFNVVQQSRVVNQKLPFLFTLKNLQ